MQPCKDIESIEICLTRLHSELCSVFASPTRLEIMLLLGEGECTVGELSEALHVALPNLSQHLRVMRDKRILRMRKAGRHVFYRVANLKYLQAIRLVREGLLEEIQMNHEAAAAAASLSIKTT